jgi:N4-gp56 family major capsid protein
MAIEDGSPYVNGTVFKDGINYNGGNEVGNESTMGNQIVDAKYHKKALIDAAKEQYFSQLSNVIGLPKHAGKTIKKYLYVPLLDDRNVNSQGLDPQGHVIADGNLWGSSKDIGTITGKLPLLSENGGRVNRVGFTRLNLESTLESMGFFDEYTAESLAFDTDDQLLTHITRESVRGASDMTEAVLQKDLLNAAGVIKYGGVATQDIEVSGEGTPSLPTYEGLMKLAITLDENRAPLQTRIITGSRYVDTKVVGSARYMYIAPDLIPALERMTDLHGNKALVTVEQYASAGTIARGEYGKIGRWRFIVVPEMLKWAGAGNAVNANPGYQETNGHYDIFPMLAVSGDSFSTIGFQTDGKTVKYKIIHKRPGNENADRHDPFGRVGFYSTQWYYGVLIERPERIACYKVVAEI